MTSDQKKNFKYLETVLSRASAGRSAGSPTASFGEIIRNMRGRMGVLKDVFLRPVQVMQDTGDATLFNNRVKALTTALFDPKWTPRVREIKEFSNKSPAAARAMVQLLDDIELQFDNSVEDSDASANQ